MNWLSTSLSADDVWKRMSSSEREEFEGNYGLWKNMSPRDKVVNFRDYHEEAQRRNAEERREERGKDAMKEIVEPLAENLEKLSSNFREMWDKIQQTQEKNNKLLEEKIKEKPDNPSSSLDKFKYPPHNPTYFTAPSKMDCVYSKEGPKGCILIQQTPEGKLYGTCTVGDQVRRKRILPILITGAINEAGCPSARMIKVCDYLKYERVKIGGQK